MRVVIRYRRKSARVEPAQGLNGVGPAAVEATSSIAVEQEPTPEAPESMVEISVPVPDLAAPVPLPPPEAIASESLLAPEPEPTVMPAQPPLPPKTGTKPEKVRCPRCNSRDTWRFGRVKGMRLAMASLARGQWITCRGCGNRFLTRYYGPMEEAEDDD